MWNSSATFTLCAMLVLGYIQGICGDIQCYKCLVATPPYFTNETIRLCQDFDYSDKFIVNCPFSTFCMKRIISAKAPYLNGTERDCASQKFETQSYHDRKWHSEVIIEEPYREGCATVDDKGARTTTTEVCYCKGRLCNDARPAAYRSPTLLVATAVIVPILRPLLYSGV